MPWSAPWYKTALQVFCALRPAASAGVMARIEILCRKAEYSDYRRKSCLLQEGPNDFSEGRKDGKKVEPGFVNFH